MTTPVIQIENLSKRYVLRHTAHNYVTLRDTIAQGFRRMTTRRTADPDGTPSREEFWALKDVSLEVREGDRVGIVGRNGAGKSTLLKILSRITEPTQGRIRIHGRVASLLEVGTGFHPDLTGRENIYLNGAILGMTRAEIRRKFDEIVAFAEVAKFLDTPVKRYSSGMFVRLAFAVAAHLDPEILVVDEVLSVGDAEFQKKCLGKMQDVSVGQGRTVLFVSHNMAAVQNLCTKGVHLQRGKLAYAGTAKEAVEHYLKQGQASDFENVRVEGDQFILTGIRIGSAGGGGLVPFKPAHVEIRFQPKGPIPDAGTHILFEDLNGAPLLGLDSNDFVPKFVPTAAGEIAARFCIAEWPLVSGMYRMRIWLKSTIASVYWEVPQIYDIEVEAMPVYGSRPIDRTWHGVAAVRATAEVTAL